jgi:hypothetical protein
MTEALVSDFFMWTIFLFAVLIWQDLLIFISNYVMHTDTPDIPILLPEPRFSKIALQDLRVYSIFPFNRKIRNDTGKISVRYTPDSGNISENRRVSWRMSNYGKLSLQLLLLAKYFLH